MPTRGEIDFYELQAYLRARGYEKATIRQMEPIGAPSPDAVKRHGYGRPIRVEFTSAGGSHDVVVRTMASDPFGHERRSDRAANLLQAAVDSALIPRHVRALDVGIVEPTGRLATVPDGEPFLLTAYAPGELYARQLEALKGKDEAAAADVARAEQLATYLVALHAEKADRRLYARSLRDTVGHGEGIFGLTDSYPADDTVLSPERLQRLETAAVAWRWRWKDAAHRACRIHGDFHPFNLLFDDDDELFVLDASRGVLGDPADDLTCLTINYLFDALVDRGSFVGPYRELWDRVWTVYLEGTGDDELLSVVPGFFTWRTLVLASPIWYPGIDDRVRGTLVRFAERLLEGEAFDPAAVERLLS